jgi:ABC-2 type transport system permease protein
VATAPPGGAACPPPARLPAARGWAAGGRFAAAAALEGVAALWRRDVLHFWRDRGQLAGSLGQALLVLVVVGQGLGWAGERGGAGAAGLSQPQFLYPGAVVTIVLASAVASVISVVWDREFGPLREVLVAPVPRWAIAAGKVLGAATTAMVPGLVMLIGAPIAGVGLGPMAALALLPALCLVAAAMSALGLLIATRMRSMESFQVVVGLVLTPLVLLSGALFPLDALPDWLVALTWLDPLSYAVDAIRQLVLAGAGAPPDAIDRLALRPLGRPLGVAGDLAVVAAAAAAMTALAAAGLRARE